MFFIKNRRNRKRASGETHTYIYTHRLLRLQYAHVEHNVSLFRVMKFEAEAKRHRNELRSVCRDLNEPQTAATEAAAVAAAAAAADRVRKASLQKTPG